MSQKPISIRLSDALGQLIENLTGSSKKSPSDVIRDVLEGSSYEDFQFADAVRKLRADKQASLNDIESAIFSSELSNTGRSLSAAEASYFISSLHDAYLSNSGFITPQYFIEAINLSQRLITAFESINVNFDKDFFISRVASSGVNYRSLEEAYADVREKIKIIPSSAIAESATRPLVIMSYKLHLLPKHKLDEILSNDILVKLYPVFLTYALTEKPAIFMRNQVTPTAELVAGNLKFIIDGSALCLVVKSENQTYRFSTRGLVILHSAIASETDMNRGYSSEIETKSLVVESSLHGVTIHERGQYRLNISKADFRALSNFIKSTFENPSWNQLLQQFKNQNGHI